VHYSGAPLRVDFGEVDSTPVVLLVEASPDTPARVADVPITSARRLRTLRGTLAELSTVDVDPDDLVKVVVTEPARAGLREEVRELLPNALEVHVERSEPAAARTPERARTDRAPADLLHDYLASRDVTDPRVEALFARLHDEVLAGE
jgi:exonuclease SbcD